MTIKQLSTLAVLALAAGAAFAQPAPGAFDGRAEVIQSVLAARAAGALVPAGEGVGPGHGLLRAGRSSLTRAQVKAEVLLARAHGDLIPAGQISQSYAAYRGELGAVSNLARAQVKADVLQARAEGALVPAGQGGYPAGRAAARTLRNAAASDPAPAVRGAT